MILTTIGYFKIQRKVRALTKKAHEVLGCPHPNDKIFAINPGSDSDVLRLPLVV